MNEYEERRQAIRTRDINRLLDIVGTGVGMRLTMKIHMELPALHTSEDDRVVHSGPPTPKPSPDKQDTIDRGHEVAEELFGISPVAVEPMPEEPEPEPFELDPKPKQKKPQQIADKGRTLKGKKRKFRAKLTNEQVWTVRRMLKSGFSQPAITKQLHLGSATVSRIHCGRSYANVPDETVAISDLREGAE